MTNTKSAFVYRFFSVFIDSLFIYVNVHRFVTYIMPLTYIIALTEQMESLLLFYWYEIKCGNDD